jgi:hypothetical protein
MNRIRERIEPTPWIIINGGRLDVGDEGCRYQYPRSVAVAG